MSNEPLVSRLSWKYFMPLIMLVVIVAAFTALLPQLNQTETIIPPGLLFIFGVPLLSLVYKMLTGAQRITIYDDRVEQRNLITGRTQTFYLSDAVYFERRVRNQRSTYTEFRLRGRDVNLRFTSGQYSNYTQISERLAKRCHGRQDKSLAAMTGQQYVLGVLAAALGFSLLLLFLIEFIDKDLPATPNDIVAVNGVLSKMPVYHVKKKTTIVTDVSFVLASSPTQSFQMNATAYHALTNSNPVDSLGIGDSVTLFVQKNEYAQYITHTQPVSFLQKMFGGRRVHVYGLSIGGKNLADLDAYNKAIAGDDDDPLKVMVLIIPGFFLIVVIVLTVKYFMDQRKYRPRDSH